MNQDILNAAKALFLHEAESWDADPESAEAAWLLDEELQGLWVERVNVVVKALGA